MTTTDHPRKFGSSELSGGAGFTFEDAAAAIYLAALLGEDTAPALPGRTVLRVAVQQAAFGEPLDDLIVDGCGAGGALARLSLQVKRELTISAAKTNKDFREIVLRAHETLSNPHFRNGVNRVGVVTGTIAEAMKRSFEAVCEWARDSATTDVFMKRFSTPGLANAQHRSIIDDIRTLLAAAPDQPIDNIKIHRLLRHFVLLHFNLLHDGSTDEAAAVARLRASLHPDDALRAHDLWQRLRVIAREASGRAAEFDRSALLARLQGSFRFVGAPSLRDSLERITEESRLALSEIVNQIGGFEVARTRTIAEAERALKNHRFVQLIGLPGTGKSGVLRAMAAGRLGKGPVLVLKSDRIAGPTWAAHTNAIGVRATTAAALLAEIAAVGCPILFIDGIDRVEVQHRGAVLDLVNTILGSPALKGAWRIVATMRDSGIEPLRTWLPSELLKDGGVATVEVEPFDDDEADALAKAIPALRPLLFGEERIQEIARRAFFAAVLANALSRVRRRDGRAAPRSEIDLLDAWWEGGGYDPASPRLPQRQRALIRLAEKGAKTLGRRIKLEGIDLGAIEDLKRDGIITDVRPGHSVKFAHDIFFEWSFVHFLIDRDEKWVEELAAVGQPPVLGRSVELLSQSTFIRDEEWEARLLRLEKSSLRPQWTRAWLLGPISAPTFSDRQSAFGDAVFTESAARLAKLVVWFQAEKTRPNPLVLAKALSVETLSPREIVQLADALAWPSDPSTWRRLCTWLIDQIARCPTSIIPDIVTVFEVWQHPFADLPNPTSQRIVDLIQTWLEDIEDRRHAEQFRHDYGPWQAFHGDGLRDLEKRLRAILLRATRVEGERIKKYLDRIGARPQIRRAVLDQIIGHAPILAEKHASELVNFTLIELKDELPEEMAAKPPHPGELAHGVSYHDWHHLAVNDHAHGYFPPSPLREPFASLFKNAPAEALRLVRELANHAITAWRQLFKLDWDRRATPLPLVLEFPWGQQSFWGDAQVYRWFRGHGAPHAVEAGLMALERWAFAEIEGGHPVDDVIRDVLSGHESCAVLGIAAALALQSNRVSKATLPLAVSQRLWHWEVRRRVDDMSRSTASLVGFRGDDDRAHALAVRASNERPVRQIDIRGLAQLFVLAPDDELRQAAQSAITAFPSDIPLEYEEERQQADTLASLRRTAELWSEVGRPENYAAEPTEDGKWISIKLNSPKAADPDVVETGKRQATISEHFALILWANDSFEHQRLSERLTAEDAIRRARPLDSPELFRGAHGDIGDDDNRRSAVAGAAAVALCFASALEPADVDWAQDVTLRAANTPEKHGDLYSGSIVIAHPSLSSARGLAAMVRRGVRTMDAKRTLIRLCGHPLEQVSAAAIAGIMGLWEQDRSFAWMGLDLGIRLSAGLRRGATLSAFGRDDMSIQDYVARVIADALTRAEQELGSAPLAPIPEPWVLAPPIERPFPGEKRSTKPVWRDPDVYLRWDFLPEVLSHIPVEDILGDDAHRADFLDFCDRLVSWTIQRLDPPWLSKADNKGHDHRSAELIEWRDHLYRFFARVALRTEVEDARRRFLDPVFVLDDDLAASLIEPFADIVVCKIMDAPQIETRMISLVELCLDRILKCKGWSHARRRDGTVYGFDLPDLVRVFLFVRVKFANGAVRFANGDWREIDRVLPIVNRFVGAVGDVPLVMSSFLTLVERAIDHYPCALFVDQVSEALAKGSPIPAKWRWSTTNRIAALIHEFAQRSQPLPLGLAQSMLRILDALVDMGDRRAAALQTSEIFKDIRV